jgi:hypothetical protein
MSRTFGQIVCRLRGPERVRGKPLSQSDRTQVAISPADGPFSVTLPFGGQSSLKEQSFGRARVLVERAWGTPTTNSGASGRYVMAWEKLFLEGDPRYKKFLLERGPLASTFQSNLN